MRIIRKFRQTLDRHHMVRGGDRILVAVSGGPDSVALLDLFLQVREELDLDLHVAHFHHGRRGKESDEDESFVESLARRNGLPCTVGRLQPPGRSGSWEEHARRERYGFLRSVRDRIGAGKVAVGHQQNDQAETFLHRLLRGSGSPGLSGIHPVWEGYLIRPLIEIPREEILEYLRARNLPFREDSSNRDRRYTRNRIRHELLPRLASGFNPGIVRTLARTAERLREEDRLLDELAEREMASIWENADPPGLAAGPLETLPPALQRRILMKATEKIRGTRRRITSRHVDGLLGLLGGEADGREVCLPENISARRRSGRIEFRPPGPGNRPPGIREFLSVPGRCDLPEAGIALRCRVLPRGSFRGDLRSGGRETAYLDADRVHPPLVVRCRKRGDRFRPFGGAGEKRLKKFFIDRKVPAEARDRWPLVTCCDEIVWVVGQQIDDRYRVRSSTRNILILDRETGPDPSAGNGSRPLGFPAGS